MTGDSPLSTSKMYNGNLFDAEAIETEGHETSRGEVGDNIAPEDEKALTSRDSSTYSKTSRHKSTSGEEQASPARRR